MWYHYLVIRFKRMNTTLRTVNDVLKKYNVMFLPDPKVVFFAYSKGQVQEFCTYRDASQYSMNVERVVINQKEINDAHEKYHRQIEAAKKEWYIELKNRYINLDEQLFDICYFNIANKNEYGIVDEQLFKEHVSFAMMVIQCNTGVL